MRLPIHIEAGGDVQGHVRLQHHDGGVQDTRLHIGGEALFLLTLSVLNFHFKMLKYKVSINCLIT